MIGFLDLVAGQRLTPTYSVFEGEPFSLEINNPLL